MYYSIGPEWNPHGEEFVITYHYQCNECFFQFVRSQSIKDQPLMQCPDCFAHALQRIYHAVPIIDNTPKTLGSLAEKNTSTLTSESRDQMWGLQKENKEKAQEAVREELAAKLPPGASIPTRPKGVPWYKSSNPERELKKYVGEF